MPQHKDIATERTTFDGTEWLVGQLNAGGVGSTFKGLLANLARYVLGESPVAGANVAGEGAIPDFTTDCTAAFKAAAAKVTERAGTLYVPPPKTRPGVTTPLYRLADGRFLLSLGSGSGAPGARTDLRYRLGLDSGPIIVPQSHAIVGRGAFPLSDSTPIGSEIRALAGFKRHLELVSLVSDGTTVTVTAKNHDLKVGEDLTVAGADQAAFNGAKTVATVTGADTFTFAADGATGTATGAALAVTTTVRPRVVQLLPSNSTSADGARVDELVINGNDRPGAIGLWSDCMQENCGGERIIVRDCHTGVKIVAAPSITPANFVFPEVSVFLSSATGNQGYGFDVFAVKWKLPKATVVLTAAGKTGKAAYRIRGQEFEGGDLHFEGADYGAVFGGTGTGIFSDDGVQDCILKIRSLHGYNRSTQPGLIAAATIDPVATNIFGVQLGSVTINQHNKGPLWLAGQTPAVGERRGLNSTTAVQVELVTQGSLTTVDEPPAAALGAANFTDSNGWEWKYVPLCALVVDPVNEIVIPTDAATGRLHITRYEFEGALGINAGRTVKRPVSTSYYDHVRPYGALKGVTAAANLDRGFTGGARADILQVKGAGTIQTLNHRYPGAVVYLHCLGGQVIEHASASGAANERIICATGASITVPAAGAIYRLVSDDYRSSTADRWYCEAV